MWSLSQQLAVGADRMVVQSFCYGCLDGFLTPDEKIALPQRVSCQRLDQDSVDGTQGGLNGCHPQTSGDHRLQLIE
ncbi:hypothetical protein AQJ30_24135 [Streptomyces longwoodensis]|uniref:Uncharacterized protein n=1 Tax=Streptomyces longwoodensis TaxID=68231 RepID=A0A117QM07_9ACTN|nr:hypothetical protein AQJ30_24135 [Streptomyces longwoodensis]